MRRPSSALSAHGRARVGIAALALALGLTAGCRLREPEPSAPAEETVTPAPPPPEASPPPPPEVAPAEPPVPDSARVLYPPQTIERLVAAYRRTVVSVRTTTPVKDGPASLYPGTPGPGDVSLGSGLVVAREGKIARVLTNAHLLARAREIRVGIIGNAEVPATVLGRDAELDVALLAIETDVPLEPARLGDSSSLRVGERVIALGNPFANEVTANAGIISSVDGAAGSEPVETSPAQYRSFLITDAAIHAGNSGGPLIDITGQVVGVNVATEPQGGRLGFAVPIDRVIAVLDMLARDGRVRRTWLGLYIQPVEDRDAQRLGLGKARGALVTDVPADTPAARAKLRAGDVILEFDGRAVDHRNLPWLVATAGPRRVPVSLWRDGREQAIEVTMEWRPE